jgi:tetratricopeptide (TPR) repeat protein
MAPPVSTPKIEELRFRLKTDPKSRLFYPLAEELRKVGAYTEAEQVLRAGLMHHPAYLSAWVSLGRVSRDQSKSDEAIEALSKALQLDPGNIVAARLLADSYLAAGEKVEAIKKYKLVHALMPSDAEVEAIIERLDKELTPIAVAEPEPEPEPEPAPLALVPEPEPEPLPFVPEPEPEPVPLTLVPEPEPVAPTPDPFAESEPEPIPFAPVPVPVPVPEPVPFAAPAPAPEPAPEPEPEPERAPLAAAPEPEPEAPLPFVSVQPSEAELAILAADDEPMLLAHDESPFEEPVADFTAAAVEIESPQGFHIEEAPLGAETPTPWTAEEEPADVFAPTEEEAAAAEPTDTVTMADLYARQGLTLDARRIYEAILQREPNNDAVRAKLDALAGDGNAKKVARLEQWLSKVSRREVTGV